MQQYTVPGDVLPEVRDLTRKHRFYRRNTVPEERVTGR
jgi:hypothetical protein